MIDKTEIATLANGCFWCTEAMFKRLKGIESVQPGYAGGSVKHPSYDQVCMGITGHTESIQIKFDPNIISFEKILDIFWHTHDPTTLNRQGNDIGTQYRSAIFFHDEKQKEIAEKSKKDLEQEGIYKNSIVTEITAFKNFYDAEDYHKNYYDEHQDAPYCNFVIDPKIHKLFKHYGNDIKEVYK
ncbi:MAG: peptide-methionine (S)-S-oxide reductase MsrA [Thermoproteota archaeon]|nr:peptide-methionine (S)-S-oxide reductase MsrA [Thermoproteota archaeon]